MSTITRRKPLEKIAKPTQNTHAGLWLDKFIFKQARSDKQSRSDLVKQVADIAVPESYRAFFIRWQQQLQHFRDHPNGDCVMKFGKATTHQQRLVLGTGNESVLETAVTLHRTYGVPYLPGSALKGLTASFARRYYGESWNKQSREYQIVFGDTDESGCMVFFDALPFYDKHLLHRDVLTPHHPKYYQPGSTVPPADWDDPNPVPFLSATGEYLIALAAPSGGEDWLASVFEILKEALSELGIGAKTSSGYGRMTLELL